MRLRGTYPVQKERSSRFDHVTRKHPQRDLRCGTEVSRPKGLATRIHNLDGLTRLGLATVDYIAGKDPGVARPEAVCALTIHSNAMHTPASIESHAAQRLWGILSL